MKYPICLTVLLFSCFSAIAQNPLTDSLIAYYPFSGNANDASGNGNNGTVYGATLTADRFGNPNSAYLFNGTSDFISYKSVSKFEPTTTPVSITFWFKPNIPSYGTLFANNYTWGIYTGFSVDMEPTGGTIEANIFDNGPTNPPNRRSIGSSINLFDNKWHFAAAIISGPLDMAIFIDCNYDTATTYDGSGGPLAYVGDTGISGRSFLLPAGYQYSLYYSGALDEIRFYHRALTKSDLILIHNYPDSTLLTVSPLDTTICSGDSVSLKASGANNYSWSPSDGLNSTNTSNPIAKPLATITYTVNAALDSFVCGSIANSTIITVNPTPSVNSGAGVSICLNSSTQLSAIGNGTYSWSPSNGLSNSTSANPLASPSATTTYSVTVSNSCGTATDSTVVAVILPPTVSISTPDTSLCPGDSIIIASNSSSNYLWSPGSGLSCTTCSSPIASPVVSTTYYLTSLNGNCETKDSITIFSKAAPSVTAGPDVSICYNTPAQLSATANGTYSWSPSNGLSNSTSSNPVARPSVTITYTITTSNSCGTATDSTIVTVIPPPLISISPQDTSICPGGKAVLSAGAFKSYSWKPASGLNCSTCQSPVAFPTASLTYTVIVTTAAGCTADTTISVNLLSAPQIDLSASIAVPCNSGVLLSPVITGDSSFHWLNAAGLTDTTSLTQMVAPPQTTNYTIVATNGTCEASATITADVMAGYVLVPNAFSPNGDGINDYFKPIYGCGFELIIFRIYNRWGQQVFETNSLSGQWDGNFNGARSPVGAYAYYVEGAKDNGEKILLKGNVTLLR